MLGRLAVAMSVAGCRRLLGSLLLSWRGGRHFSVLLVDAHVTVHVAVCREAHVAKATPERSLSCSETSKYGPST